MACRNLSCHFRHVACSAEVLECVTCTKLDGLLRLHDQSTQLDKKNGEHKMSKLPLSVRITDVIHRTTVLGLFGIAVIGTGSIFFNIWANSDFAKMNKDKLKFHREEYDKARAAQASEEK